MAGITSAEVSAQARVAAHMADVGVAVELETPEMTLNIGPQHPSTHGVFRLVARVEGEKIEDVEPVIGYMHRGYEKLCEVRTYPQITTLVNRIDWLSGYANEIPFILAAERLMGIEAPPRVQYIRTILTEMARIATFLAFLGVYGIEIGAITPIFHAFRDRERVLDLIESVTGGRFHPNFNRVGGLLDDLPAGFLAETAVAMDAVKRVCDDLEDLILGNDIFRERTVGVGVIPLERGLACGVSGANIRASGCTVDIRRDEPYLAYPELDFDVVTDTRGDCFARAWCRLQETREAVRIIEGACKALPAGPFMAKVPKVIQVPPGEVYQRAEGPLGEMGFYLVSRGGRIPYRVKIRTPSFSNVSILPWLLEGTYMADLIAIVGSLYFILGDVDR
ncbi:MAG: NADH-quinone oxidoreductase subunit D [Acidimicrobiia bacterium]|nr:NADH-quinone oxidoreductase subunit D [Acidimicrobiia bacterium]